jgi:hypothetical protein
MQAIGLFSGEALSIDHVQSGEARFREVRICANRHPSLSVIIFQMTFNRRCCTIVLK